ncbi:hypothetical protein [Streptomyces sp. NPDC006971]|uniref:hypothetical protein n=1 Tax=Streptomyces sp. NPDC006971 TaxID=3154784 RepID=UPI0033DE2F22
MRGDQCVPGMTAVAVGFLGLGVDAPYLLAAVRTAAHDDAYLTYRADRDYDRAVTTTPVHLDRRTR